jgi:hypothetical protein
MTRHTRTPQQRAEEALEVAARIADRLTEQATRATAEAERLTVGRDAAVRRRDHLAQHPDLPAQQTEQDPSTTTSTGDTA